MLASSTLASESYPAEYSPGEADAALMTRISTTTGGRGAIAPEQSWDTEGLAAGVRRVALAGPFLLLAALLWPLAVALSRLSLRGATAAGARAGASNAVRRLRDSLPRLGSLDPHHTDSSPTLTRKVAPPPTKGDPPPSASPSPSPRAGGREAAGKQTAAVNELLARKRARQQGDDGPADPP